MTPVTDFNKWAGDYLPPAKRKRKWFSWGKILVSQTKRLYENLYSFWNGKERDSNVEPVYYSDIVAFTYDDKVIYNYKVYQSMISPNLNNRPDLNSDPTDENRKWDLIYNNFIGAEERSKYTFQRLIAEFALNHYFQKELSDNSFVGFVQPDDPINPTRSSIYISTLTPVYTSFVSSTSESTTSKSYSDKADGFVFTDEVYSTQSSYFAQINIPSAVFASINSDATIAENIVRKFIDTFCVSGINYIIVTY